MMSDQTFQIGDQIVHRSHGPGTITGIEEKRLAEKLASYYVVKTSEATLWVPLDSPNQTIRLPLTRPEFQNLLRHLCGPSDPLPENHRERQWHLAERMRYTHMRDVCFVIRDLEARSNQFSLNKNDRDVMGAAKDILLNEWEIVFGEPRPVAEENLDRMLTCHQVPAD